MTIEGKPAELKQTMDLFHKKSNSPRPKSIHNHEKNSKKDASFIDLIIDLKDAGFFKKPRPLSEIKQKLAERGYHYQSTSMTRPLQRALRADILGRRKIESGVWGYVKE